MAAGTGAGAGIGSFKETEMKRIIIIGATSGIGKELALLYAKQGHRIGISGRRNQLLQEVKNNFPDRISTSCFDAAGTENLSHLQAMIDELGGLDLFIYNAGFGEPSENIDLQAEMDVTDTVVNGFLKLSAFVFLYFAQKGEGQLAVTSSVAGLRGNSFTPAYSAGKAFASTYAEGLNIKARKWGKQIVFTDLRPGFVNTKPFHMHGRFWVATPQKAAAQMAAAINRKKRVAYITRRWWLVAQLLKLIPYALYRRFA